jgi:hypothetical protein
MTVPAFLCFLAAVTVAYLIRPAQKQVEREAETCSGSQKGPFGG